MSRKDLSRPCGVKLCSPPSPASCPVTVQFLFCVGQGMLIQSEFLQTAAAWREMRSPVLNPELSLGPACADLFSGLCLAPALPRASRCGHPRGLSLDS